MTPDPAYLARGNAARRAYEGATQVTQPCCEHPGCGKPATVEVDGRDLCATHAKEAK